MPAATSWGVLLTNDGASSYTVTCSRNGTIASGTALALPTGETGSFSYLPAVIERCKRKILAAIAAGTISAAQNIGFKITVSSDSTGPLFTGSAQYGAVALSGGSAITFPTGETTGTFLQAALQRAQRVIKNDYADNG